MAKQKLSTDNSQLYAQLETRSKRINFLIQSRRDLLQDSMLSPTVECDFIDNGFSDLFDRIKLSSKDAIDALLDVSIADEEKKLADLFNEINSGRKI